MYLEFKTMHTCINFNHTHFMIRQTEQRRDVQNLLKISLIVLILKKSYPRPKLRIYYYNTELLK